MAAERMIGIDFGTSTSVIRVKRYQDGKPVVDGGRLDTKEVIFGGLYQTVPTIIQKVGQNTYFGHDAVQPKKKAVTCEGFKVDLESDDEDRKKEARELTEEFLVYLRKAYSEQSNGGHLGDADDVERTIISYPVKWSKETKLFMREAAERAGFPNVEGMDEARAAIQAVTLQSEDYLKSRGYLVSQRPCVMLLIDMGAGTTDLVLSRYTPGEEPKNEILCTWPEEGQILFGGQEADEVLRKYIISILPEENADDIMKRLDRKKSNYKSWKENMVSPALLRNEAVEEFYELDTIVDDLGVDMEEYSLNRAGFESFAKGYLLEFPQLIQDCLKKANVRAEDVELVILTGGHSQWYFVKEMLTGSLPEICGALLPKLQKDPGRIIPVSRPQETVALGLVYSPMSAEVAVAAEPQKEESAFAVTETAMAADETSVKSDYTREEPLSRDTLSDKKEKFRIIFRRPKAVISNVACVIVIKLNDSTTYQLKNGESIELVLGGVYKIVFTWYDLVNVGIFKSHSSWECELNFTENREFTCSLNEGMLGFSTFIELKDEKGNNIPLKKRKG